MMNLLRSEWIKLRTVTMNWVLAIIAIVFPLAVTLITAGVNGDQSDFSARTLLELISGSSFVSVLLLGTIAVSSITSEFGFGTIRPTFAAVPRRGAVIVAKGVVAVFSAMGIQSIVVTIGVIGGKALADSRGASIDMDSESTLYPVLIGIVLLAGLAALFGYGIGMLIRNTPASIAVFILWPLLAEGLIGGLLFVITRSSSVPEWMPFRAGFRLAAVSIGSSDSGPTRVVAGIYFGGVSLALASLGAWMVNRRDA